MSPRRCSSTGWRPLIIHSFIWAGLALLLLPGVFPGAPAGLILVLFAACAVSIGRTQSLSRIGTDLVPQALTHLVIGTTMIIAAVITLIGAVVSVAWAPETRGLRLGEYSALPATPAASGRFHHTALEVVRR